LLHSKIINFYYLAFPGHSMQEHCLIEVDGIQTCVTKHELEISKSIEWVTDPECGGISTFIGTTRNTFQGKKVLKLEYEAYVPMAQKKLREMCEEGMRKWDVRKISIWHRIDTVLVMEASVIIAASSPHRRDAIEVC